MSMADATPSDATPSAVARALGRIPSGLFVVSAGDRSLETAFLASWITQAGFEPPSITVAVGLDRPARAMMEPADSAFAVSIIGQDERGKLGPYFKGVDPAPAALDGYGIERSPSGLALVEGCLAWLECRSRDSLSGGDHLIILAEVVAASVRDDGEPTVHLRSDGLRY